MGQLAAQRYSGGPDELCQGAKYYGSAFRQESWRLIIVHNFEPDKLTWQPGCYHQGGGNWG